MMKKLYAIIFIFLLTLPAVAQRIEYSLDGGDWKFKIDPDSIGYQSWYAGLNDAEIVKVPHTWNVDPKHEEYIGLAWYEKNLSVPKEWKGKQIRLHFDAVYRDMVVYINGKQVGSNSGIGYTPVSFDITKKITYGNTNKIIVSVSNQYSDCALPYKAHFDWTNDGGIIRPVKLIITDGSQIRYAHIKPTVQFKDSTATATIAIKTWENNINQTKAQLIFSEYKTGKVILEKAATLQRNKEGIFETDVKFSKIRPWHFDSPELYVMQVKLYGKKGIADEYTTRFGFRKIEVKGDQLFLNEEAVRLPGVEYMAGSHPMYGMAEPIEIQQQAIKLMKELNCVITRFHWQQDSRLLDLMDENGILAQEEIPWWQAPGNLSPELEVLAKKHVDQMIERDLNHPCVFSWGISNEVFYNTDKDIYRRLINHARRWGGNTLTTVVSNEIFIRLQNDESLLGDMPTWNDYGGTWHGEKREDTPNMLSLIHEKALGGRPLLITEHGLCEPRFLGGDTRRITEMTYHYDLWAKSKFIVGCIYFSLNDYRTHVGEAGTGRYKARIHGLTDYWLNPKPSYQVYKGLAAPIYFENVHQTGNHAKVTLTVKNDLPSYILRQYKLQWKDAKGEIRSKILPDLKPGEKYDIILENLPVDRKLDMTIIRPTNFVVAKF